MAKRKISPSERYKYRQALRQQLMLWLIGQPTHLPEPWDECCPDFSCCYPDMLMPEDERRDYVMRHLDSADVPSRI
jgi:hypothetical protein